MNPRPPVEDRKHHRIDQVHASTEKVLLDTFPEVMINGYSYTEQEVWDVLLYASLNRISIKGTCDRLSHAPSYNWIYGVVSEEVLDRYGIEILEQRANEAIEQTHPKGLARSRRKIAIDLVLIPYYGDETTPGVSRSHAVRSTTKFFCFATAYLIKKHKRVTLCLTFVRPEDTLPGVLIRLLDRVAALGIAIKRLLLDRQFAQVAVLDYLSEQPYVSIVPIPKRGKRLKALLHGKQSFTVPYTMRSSEHGEITFPLYVAVRYQKGKARRHGVEHLPFAVLGECHNTELEIAEDYRHRFGIESSYRIMNQTRAKTTSRDERFRLLLVFIAFLLQNFWIWYKWKNHLVTKETAHGRSTLTFDLFALFIRVSIENVYGVLISAQL